MKEINSDTNMTIVGDDSGDSIVRSLSFVTKDQIRKNDLKEQVKWKATKNTWFQVLKSNKALARWLPEKN